MLVPLDIGLVLGLILAWVVIALALAFRLLDFPDLTVEGSLSLGAAVFAVLIKNGSSMPTAITCAVLAGGVAGALTGFIHVRFRLNKFLSGIIVVAIAYSLSLRIMGASNIGLLQSPNIFDSVESLNNSVLKQIHLGSILLLAALLLIGFILILSGLSTRYGLGLRVAGSNPDYARSLGINVPLNIVFGLFITNCLAAFSGVLLSMNQGFTDISMGQGILILALAAMTIGERLLPEKAIPFHIFVLCAAIFGSVVYQVLVACAVHEGLAATDLKLVTAVLVLLVVAFKISRNGDFVEGDQ
jgi:putative ABC transport system permease protein